MSNIPQVVVLDELFSDAHEAVQKQYPALEVRMAGNGSERAALIAGADVLVVQKEPVSDDLLATSDKLRLLMKMGRVYDHIDMEAVRKRNIPMAISPRKGPNCVAELALTLMLALSKELLRSHNHVSNGDYRQLGLKPQQTTERAYAFKWMQQNIQEISGRTLGLVGMGEIGAELARRARVMGMNILYHKRTRLSTDLEDQFEVSYSDLHSLLEASDYVCLAVPHTPETERMIGREELRLIGPQGYLVNIARGGLVDEAALVQALQKREIAGAGLDVFAYEPLPYHSPLCQLENVILTPHIGGGSGSNATQELAAALAEVTSILAGEHPLASI